MEHQIDYINDPYFMKWIFQSDPLSEKYWTNFMEANPKEKSMILSLKKELDDLKLKNQDLSEDEKRLLLASIIKKNNQQEYASKVRLLGSKFLRYAAVAVSFLVIGSMLMYLYLNESASKINYADLEYSTPVDKPRLILSNGSDIELEKNSIVKYNKDSNIIVDNHIVELGKDDQDIKSNQIIIPSGSRSVITLSDNTVVHLNAGSKLVYPSTFSGKEREVLLFGEAFFEVTKNKEKPFIVRTSSLSIQVLGTKFNVSAYSQDNILQTVLVEGEVSVKRNNAPFYERSLIMAPNQMVTYDKKTNVFESRFVDTADYTLWKDGMLKFEKEDLSRIVKKLERFYNINIRFEDPLKGGVKISGKLDLSENKYDVFTYLSALTNMNFTEINSTNYIMK